MNMFDAIISDQRLAQCLSCVPNANDTRILVDEVRKLKDALTEAQRERDAEHVCRMGYVQKLTDETLKTSELQRQVDELKALAGQSICAWCGAVGPRDADFILSHQQSCTKRQDAFENENRTLQMQLDLLKHRDEVVGREFEKAKADRDTWKRRAEEAEATAKYVREAFVDVVRQRDAWRETNRAENADQLQEYYAEAVHAACDAQDQLKAAREVLRKLVGAVAPAVAVLCRDEGVAKSIRRELSVAEALILGPVKAALGEGTTTNEGNKP